ncbi:MAG: hypothetical protein LJE70_11625, partial [Chromatiaceae bacterium]|nr:hypothetical protein [Chromatiaceae bacterium]
SHNGVERTIRKIVSPATFGRFETHQVLFPPQELTFDQAPFASQLPLYDRGQKFIADLPSCCSNQYACRFLVQLDHFPKPFVSLSVLECHLLANLQTVPVELACRAPDGDIRTIEIDVIERNIPKLTVMAVFYQGSRSFQLDNPCFDQPVFLGNEVLDILTDLQRVLYALYF